MGEDVLYIAVYSSCGGAPPTSAWTEETLTHLTLHVMAPYASPRTSSFTVTVWEVHPATPLGTRLLCYAAKALT